LTGSFDQAHEDIKLIKEKLEKVRIKILSYIEGERESFTNDCPC
jgi:hypothetical protein